jgi:hypothetical protein
MTELVTFRLLCSSLKVKNSLQAADSIAASSEATTRINSLFLVPRTSLEGTTLNAALLRRGNKTTARTQSLSLSVQETSGSGTFAILKTEKNLTHS